jgi:hypothetical protein
MGLLVAQQPAVAEGQRATSRKVDLLKKQDIVFNMKVLVSDSPLHQRVLQRVEEKGRGWAFTPYDFADLSDPRCLGVVLTRLVRQGKIRRVARGIYDCPHPHPVLGQAGATADAVVDALARGRHLRLLPSPQVAANQLGLTTQVPAQLVYQTDGAPAKIMLGKRQIIFRRNTGRSLALAGRASGLVAQALRDLGKDNITPEVIQHLHARLDVAARQQLLADLTLVPAWMRPVFLKISRSDA